jgi:hypothetical protein
MLRLTLEIVPFGVEEKKKVLGTMSIINTGYGSWKTGVYMAKIEDVNGLSATVSLSKYPRKYGAWFLANVLLDKFGNNLKLTCKKKRNAKPVSTH